MFRIFCNNKGCFKESEPVYDKSDDKVYCGECNKPMDNVTDFTKRQMAGMGQVRKNERIKQAWAVKCESCKKEGPPKLDGNKLVCGSCAKELTKISKPFAESIKLNLKLQKRA